MEKMIWEKPQMNEVAFAANEYVAACGDSGRTYKFECTAPAGIIFGRPLYYYANQRVDEKSTVPTTWGTKTYLGSYTPCSSEGSDQGTHIAESTDEFYWGFVDYDLNSAHDTTGSSAYDPIETVIVWIERDTSGSIENAHATTALDMDLWETAKS